MSARGHAFGIDIGGSGVKGAVVGLQWAFRMHGFDPNNKD